MRATLTSASSSSPYIRRLRGILKRLGPTAEPLQDGSCVLARIHLKPAIESGLDAVVKIVQLLILQITAMLRAAEPVVPELLGLPPPPA